jgi:hypothetical protein
MLDYAALDKKAPVVGPGALEPGFVEHPDEGIIASTRHHRRIPKVGTRAPML